MNSANKEWKDERHWRIHRERSLYTDEDAYSQLLDKIKQWRKTDLQTYEYIETRHVLKYWKRHVKVNFDREEYCHEDL